MLTDMLKFISNYQISHRLIVAFVLAALIPSLMIAYMGNYYVTQTDSRGAALTVMMANQDQAGTVAAEFQNMYSSTASLETLVLDDLLVPNIDVHNSTFIKTLKLKGAAAGSEDQFIQDLESYQSEYAPGTGSKMGPVTQLLNAVAPNDDQSTLEGNALRAFATDWETYQQAQNNELNLLYQIETTPDYFAELISPSGTTTSTGATIPTKGFQTTTLTQQQPDYTKLTAYVQQLSKEYTNVTQDWNNFISSLEHVYNELSVVNQNQIQPIITVTVVFFILDLLIVLLVGFVILRSIIPPMNELVDLTKRISRGDTAARAQVNSRDELAVVANAMNNMLENIVHLIQETQAQRDVLQGQVEKLVSEVSGVGEGDLRVQAEVTADALGVLADSFNYMVEELGSLVVRVKSVAREVEESTTMTSDRMNELVETSDRQIKQIAGAAMEIERMAQNSQQVAGRAMALANSAREARVNAQGGRLAVQQTIEGMGRIHANVQETSSKVQTLGDRSREINNIVDAISTIAHQTNRLALDAAIQAAMAGDNGKGFGAVAADIRRLAERAKEQATSVGRIVRSVRDDIGAVALSMRDTERETSAGAQLAEEAGTSLESIFTVVDKQAREIDVINQMAMQQQQTSSDVVQIMQGVSETTQSSTSSTRGAAQNMERVARLAEQLLASVEAFKLRENQAYFAPSGSSSLGSDGQFANQLTATGHFRTVTATAQPVSGGGFFSPGNGFTSSPFASDPFGQPGNGNSQQLFLPPAGGNGGRGFQPALPGGPQSFPALNAGATPFGAQDNSPLSFPGVNSSPLSYPQMGNGNGFSPLPPQNDGLPGFPPLNDGNSQSQFSPQNGWGQPGQQSDWPSGNWKKSDWE
jgi:methyl-accepting chemotaxis protein